MKFEDMHLSPEIIKILAEHEITAPTDVQQQVIPALLAGKDILAQSETGSGKTLGFAIPIIEKIELKKGVQTLVLAPTRELAQQIAKEFYTFSRHTQARVLCVYGGVSINPQLERAPFADIVVGTPGRVLDLLERRGLNLTKIRWAVLDEADRMLDMGFIDDIQKIMDYTPKQKQTLFFSATIPEQIAKLSKRYLHDPVRVSIGQTTQGVLTQYYYSVPPHERFSLLVYLLKKEQNKRTLVFCRTRRTCQAVADGLRRYHVFAESLHGGMSQAQRDRAIALFKEGKLPILIGTDVAARGLHIDHITYVYNYELPPDFDTYIHRVGRTARAGESGIAISFVNMEDREVFTQVLRHYEGAITKAELEEFPRLLFSYPGRGGGRGSGFRPRFHGQNGQNRNFPQRGRGQFRGFRR